MAANPEAAAPVELQPWSCVDAYRAAATACIPGQAALRRLSLTFEALFQSF